MSLRRAFRALRGASFRHLYPRAPRLHSFVFFELRRRVIASVALVSARQLERLPAAVFRFEAAEARGAYQPLVSVVVPSYNHAAYLEERLRSIARQTYPNLEVILLDDASTDGSLEMLRAFAAEHPHRTRLQVNAENSGSAFSQWRAGIAMAQGELIWVAESDDSCDRDFLAELVPLLADPAVMVAFARTEFVGPSATRQVWSMEDYTSELEPRTWQQPFVISAQRLVGSIWGRKNVIPNASSAVFRRPLQLELLEDPGWQRMRVCGDWLLYLHVARGGFVAYTPATTSYYRQHEDNLSVSLHGQEAYLAEHVAVAGHVARDYRLDPATVGQIRLEAEGRWQQHRAEPFPSHLERRLDAVEAGVLSGHERRPHLLMAVYSLVPGGGEILPLRLANLLKERGHIVSVLDLNQRAGQPGVRAILRPDIPLLRLRSLADLPAILDDLAIDLVHTHHTWVDATLAELLSGTREVAQVVTSHGMYDDLPDDELQRLARLLTPWVREVTYVADKNRAALLEMGLDADRLTKIPNATDRQDIHPLDRQSLGIPAEAFVLCIISRAVREKGWQEAIEAVRLAQSRTSRELHLLIGGDGPELHRLRRLGQDDAVHFLGLVAQPSDAYAAADVGILPSFYAGESAPLSLIECLAAGRPFLASDVGEIGAMLTTTQGMAGFTLPLVDGRPDAARFADRIVAYVEDEDLYRRHRDLAREAYQAFRPEAMASAYEAVYARALARAQVASR